MRFIPNTTIKKSMLREIGLKDIDELFSDIPKNIRITGIKISDGMSQQEVERQIRDLGKKNKSFYDMPSFLGGGIKPHYVPAAVKSIISRSEFYTSYTPYQPEASQGFLQAMFEYQSMIAELTGMDIANASLYDGVTSLGEAALMCSRITKRKKFVIPQNISWEKKSVLKNYVEGAEIKVIEIPYDKETGKIDLDEFKKYIDEETAGIYVENPNFFGVFEDDVDEIYKITRKVHSLFVVGIDPLSLGVIKSPGEYGADIVIGEGRSLGNHMSFGGGSLGIFACKHEFLRQMPGRIIGMTKDMDGKRAFCMTLQTREQHIRRGRATSNICTNEGLYTLAAVVYLSWLGGEGLEELSKINLEKGQKLAKTITSIKGFDKVFTGAHFNEFVIRYQGDINKLHKILLQNGLIGGLILDKEHYGLKNCMLFGVTEMHSDAHIEKLISVLEEVA